jgi:hypothetical protein
VTGSRGPYSKQPGRAVGHRAKLKRVDDNDAAASATVTTAELPQPPAGLLRKHRQQWFEFWGTEDGQALGERYLPQVRRLFQLRDQFERAMRSVRKEPVVLGSMGQPRPNPMGDYALKAEAAVGRIEGQLIRALLAQGRTGGGAIHSLEEMNRTVSEPFDPDQDEDPRTAALLEPDQDERREVPS